VDARGERCLANAARAPRHQGEPPGAGDRGALLARAGPDAAPACARRSVRRELDGAVGALLDCGLPSEQGLAEAVLEIRAISRRKDERYRVAPHFHLIEKRP